MWGRSSSRRAGCARRGVAAGSGEATPRRAAKGSAAAAARTLPAAAPPLVEAQVARRPAAGADAGEGALTRGSGPPPSRGEAPR